jgi:hypothetical protein
MAVGKSWLAAVMMMMMLPLLLAAWPRVRSKKRRRIVFGYLHKGRDREVCRNAAKLVGNGRAYYYCGNSGRLTTIARATWT